MTNIRKKIHKKISQSGSMMVEAMAMLALIALVTPTLYKKSAERTTELQDINTATHVRTLAKAVDNYVSANYQALLEGNLNSANAVHEIAIDSTELASYLPYGYSFDNLKNFGIPRVRLKRQGDSGSITAFVQFPKKTDIGEIRAARIASMVGSNGGYINRKGVAKGVGGVWNLESSDISNLNLDTSKGSIVVASSESINSATSGALENEKYLQRTQVENEAELWRNTMSTDLYMGGVAESATMNKILGVKQMIIGATDSEDDGTADLILSAGSENGGSAWLAGNLSALEDVFKVEQIGEQSIMDFGSVLNATYTNENESEISFNNDSIVFTKGVDDLSTATFDTDTSIARTLSVDGDTDVAINPGAVFKAGQDGKYIIAEENKLNLLEDNIITETNGDIKLTTVGTDFVVTNKTNLQGETVVGSNTNKVNPKFLEVDPIFNVQGNAFVSDTLEANKIKTEDFDALALRAGGTLENPNRWLKANSLGVTIADVDNPEDKRLVINNTESTKLLGKDGYSKVDLGDTDAVLQGGDLVNIYTEETEGLVNLQDGAIQLNKKLEDAVNPTNQVQINSQSTDIYSDEFKVGKRTDVKSANYILTMKTPNGGDTTVNSSKLTLDTTDLEGAHGQLTITGNDILAVSPNSIRYTDGEVMTESYIEMDPEGLRVSALNQNKNILNVSTDPFTKTNGTSADKSSVYIRRGAIELEKYDPTVASGEYDANAGMGYIEASRFVSNAVENDSVSDIAEPIFAKDYTVGSYYGGYLPEHYDKYMVNPAYTSVMHDIKLTTRGGARLSDILPDFINKGIYVISNTYEDTVNINNITVKNENGRLVAYHDSKAIADMSGEAELFGAERWASAFMGVVPSPQCPPGHARVITVTPAGFQMAQAGQLQKETANNPFGGSDTRFVMNSDGGQEAALGEAMNKLDTDETLYYASRQEATIPLAEGVANQIYYLGYDSNEIDTATCKAEECYPKPLYFQQSTWLRSEVIPQALDVGGSCGNTCGSNFVGWSTIMGFVYPGNKYTNIITSLMGSGKSANENEYYWNVFPVQTATLEGYATVYCYFDRTNIFDSGIDSKYVDQYDQLNNFRQGYDKHGETNNAESTSDNTSYLERLNDKTLKYSDPW